MRAFWLSLGIPALLLSVSTLRAAQVSAAVSERSAVARVSTAVAHRQGQPIIPLQSGVPEPFNLPAVTQPTLFSSPAFRIDVPEEVQAVAISIRSGSADVDLFADQTAVPSVVDGTVVADYSSFGPTGNEVIMMTSFSDPPLVAGSVFIALALFTLNTQAPGIITATLLEEQVPPPAQPTATAESIITTVAGTDQVFQGDGRPALGAALGLLAELAVSPAGEVHFADFRHFRVMKVRDDGVLEVIAGNGLSNPSGSGGPARRAGISPSGVAFDASGQLYIAESLGFLTRVSQDGILSRLITFEQVTPRRVALDAGGNFYISEMLLHRVVKITPSGEMSVIAGTGEAGFSGDSGPGDQSQLSSPGGLAVDQLNNVYIADSENHRVRRVSPDGVISTFAGNGQFDVPDDGVPAATAPLAFPQGLTIGPSGEIYIAAALKVVRIDSDGIIRTVAGRGFDFGDFPAGNGDGGPATAASLGLPRGVALDSVGNVFILDGELIRRVGVDGVITTVAGGGVFGFAGDGGPAVVANLNLPRGVTADARGGIIISDFGNNRLRRVDQIPSGIIDTIAGSGAFSVDGVPATETLLVPQQTTIDAFDNIFVADSFSVRKIDTGGIIFSVAGPGPVETTGEYTVDGPATLVGLTPSDVAVDPTGDLVISDAANHRVYRVAGDGVLETIAGTGIAGFSGDGGPALLAQLFQPSGVASASDGSVYVADTGNHVIRRIALDGSIVTVAGTGEPGNTGDGGPANLATLREPLGMAFDRFGALYVADSGNGLIRRITSNGMISTAAGQVNPVSIFPGDGMPASQANLSSPFDVDVGALGNIYIAEPGRNRIRAVLANPPALFDIPVSRVEFSASSGGPPTAAEVILVSTAVPGLALTTEMMTADGADWLEVSPEKGATPRRVELRANPADLAPGDYGGIVMIRVPDANPAARMVEVALSVGAPEPPRLSVDIRLLSFTYTRQGTPRSQTFTVFNLGGGSVPLALRAETDQGGAWLNVSPTQQQLTPAAPVTVSVTADPDDLLAGTYTGRVIVDSPQLEQTIRLPVTMTVSEVEQAILLSQSGLSFTSVAAGGIVPPQTFGVLNAGRGTMNWTATPIPIDGGDWLLVNPNSGSSNPGADVPLVDVHVDQSGLAPGEYYGMVEIRAPEAANTPHVVPVFLEVLPFGSDPGASVVPGELVFVGTDELEAPSSQDILVYNITAGPKTFRSAGSSELPAVFFESLPTDAALDPLDPTRVVVQLLGGTGFFNPGPNRGALSFQFSDGRVREVSIVVIRLDNAGARLSLGPSQAVCRPTRLIPTLSTLGSDFAVSAGWPVGLQAQVVDDCGQPLERGSVTVEFSNGDPEVSMQSLKNGRWDGTWRTNARQPSAVTLRVQAEQLDLGISGSREVTGRLRSRLERPDFIREGVVGAASFDAEKSPAPGTLISIFGERLSEQMGAAESLPLPQQLQGTTVVIAGRPMPLLFTSQGQVNAMVPFDLEQNTSHRMVIRRDRTISDAVDVSIAPAQPAVFLTQPGAGTQGHIYKFTDAGTQLLAGPANPVQAGEAIILYCSGLGAVDPPVEAGAAAPSTEPLARTVNSVQVTVGSVAANVFFSGLTPGFSGLYQVNAFVPEGVTPGNDVPVVLSVAGQSSPVATLSVQ